MILRVFQAARSAHDLSRYGHDLSFILSCLVSCTLLGCVHVRSDARYEDNGRGMRRSLDLHELFDFGCHRGEDDAAPGRPTFAAMRCARHLTSVPFRRDRMTCDA